MKLISMTNKVLEINQEFKKNILNYNVIYYFKKIVEYAEFLKQPLQLGFFVPCDLDGNVLEEPKIPHTFSSENSNDYITKWEKELGLYQQAKERVIFEGFEYYEVSSVSSSFQDIQIMKFKNGNTQYWLTDYTKENPKQIMVKNVEDLVPYNLTITENAIKKNNL